MRDRCTFCGGAWRANGSFVSLPRGRQFSFDPERGRLWVVCRHCYRWSLVALEDRPPALFELERAVRDRGWLLGETANVQLFRVAESGAGRWSPVVSAGVLILRVGRARLPERAWWRHGQELRRRRSAIGTPRSRISTALFAALRRTLDVVGLGDDEVVIPRGDDPAEDILRWRRFGWAAWRGRERCPYCRSTLRALSYDLSWWVYPLMGSDGELELGVPCPRCDPWTPDNVYRIRGPEAGVTLRRLLAYQNVSGASGDQLTAAGELLSGRGSVQGYLEDVSRARSSLWKMGTEGTVALEIAVSELQDEGPGLLRAGPGGLEATRLETEWRHEEVLARIMDEELGDPAAWRAFLHRLPVRIRPRTRSRLSQ